MALKTYVLALWLPSAEWCETNCPRSLTEEETEKLHASANALKDVIAQIDL